MTLSVRVLDFYDVRTGFNVSAASALYQKATRRSLPLSDKCEKIREFLELQGGGRELLLIGRRRDLYDYDEGVVISNTLDAPMW